MPLLYVPPEFVFTRVHRLLSKSIQATSSHYICLRPINAYVSQVFHPVLEARLGTCVGEFWREKFKTEEKKEIYKVLMAKHFLISKNGLK
jgi:hypothetical protein